MMRVFILVTLSVTVISVNYAAGTMSKTNGPTSGHAGEGIRARVRVSGRVVHRSDIPTIPSFPYSRGTVLAITAERWDELMNRLGLRGPLQHVQFAVARETFVEFVAGAARIEGDGRYELSLDPGRYVICVGNLAGPPPDPARYSASINGCVQPVRVEGKQRVIEIFFGESGVTRR